MGVVARLVKRKYRRVIRNTPSPGQVVMVSCLYVSTEYRVYYIDGMYASVCYDNNEVFD